MSTRRQVVAMLTVLALVAAVLLLRGGSASQDAAAGPDLVALRAAADLAPCPAGIGADLPRLTLPCLGGGPAVALRGSGSGLPTLVNIWAQWCAPCVREVPDLVALAEAGAGRLSVVGVLHEAEHDQALEFARQYGMHYPSVIDDDGAVLRRFAPGPPATLFVDAAGRVVYVQRGQFASLAEITSLVRQHLGVVL